MFPRRKLYLVDGCAISEQMRRDVELLGVSHRTIRLTAEEAEMQDIYYPPCLTSGTGSVDGPEDVRREISLLVERGKKSLDRYQPEK